MRKRLRASEKVRVPSRRSCASLKPSSLRSSSKAMVGGILAARAAGRRREARAAARLAHPNVVAVYDSGEERGLPFIVMEYVSGQTLRQLLEARGRLDPEATAELLGPVADALDHAHHAGIAHLDVKPENVLLSGETVKVADFGLVRAAAQG